jgi:hypothetical protein
MAMMDFGRRSLFVVTLLPPVHHVAASVPPPILGLGTAGAEAGAGAGAGAGAEALGDMTSK